MEPQPLTFRTGRTGDEALLAVAGEVDLATAESLYEQATAQIQEGTHLLVLDLGGVTFCDSLGVAALVRIYRYAAKHDSRLRITNPQGHIAHVLQISGLDQVFEVQTG